MQSKFNCGPFARNDARNLNERLNCDVRIMRVSVALFKIAQLEPIQEEWVHEQGFGLVKRLSMMRIMARRTKAATVPA